MRILQSIGNFVTKSSNWINTPSLIKKNQKYSICYLRNEIVFIYYNGAESYFATKVFRSYLRI
ncbi:DUF4256 domain-containing protein [Christiangramia forsetii]|uniref:DUF4256 domain-containing protein n=1 Tax=Christiangramia forsetii TaxID=411153 RepID=UPI000A031E9B